VHAEIKNRCLIFISKNLPLDARPKIVKQKSAVKESHAGRERRPKDGDYILFLGPY
jgi:hypothetical protein